MLKITLIRHYHVSTEGTFQFSCLLYFDPYVSYYKVQT